MSELITESSKKDFPSFYSIMPATVRYSKDIGWAEKVLYSEISSLTNKYGYCYAKNSYFAEVFNISKDSVSRLLKNLETNHFINMTVIRNDKKEVVERRITINTSPEIFPYLPEEIQGGTRKNAKDNNTSINNINLNTYSTSSLRSEDVHFVHITADELANLKRNVPEENHYIFDLLTENEDGTFSGNSRFNSELLDTYTPSFVSNFIESNKSVKSVVDSDSNSKEKEGVPLEERESRIDNLNFDTLKSNKTASETDEKGSRIDYDKKIDNLHDESKKNASKAVFEKLGLVQGTEYQADNNPPKKAKRKPAAKPKELTDLQRVKNHFLDNRKKLFEEGKVATPLDSTNSALINKRLNSLFDMGITVEQFGKVFDLAMTDRWCVEEIGFSFQKLISETVFMRLFNDKRSRVIEKKPEPMKNIRVIQRCAKCGEELNSFGTCSFCD